LEIKDYSEENKAEIKGKTRLLDFGKIGFRQSTKITMKSIQAVLKSLKAREMDDCIRIKEEVNKEALGEYPDEVITAVGASKKMEDVFWYEVDREKLADIT
jgi:phage host-nuclease inhibitor protein Gam